MKSQYLIAAVLLAVAVGSTQGGSSTTATGVPVAGTIATFAGSDAGDGGPATNATLNEPESIAVTSAADLYVLDSTRCRIRKVSAGVITNVAGNGVCSYSADGSIAASSPTLPTAVAVGPGGSVYFTEASGGYEDSCRVRKIVAGLLTTIGGNGTCNDPVNGGGATSTPLLYPTMLAVDGNGAAYVSGISDCRVWKISAGVITHVAGDKCGINFDANPLNAWITPVSIAVDAAGTNLYIAENNYWSQCYIVRVSGGVLSLFAGVGLCGFTADGPLASARIAPRDVEVGSTGDVFFADGCSARKISGGVLSTVATCVAGPTPYLLGLVAHRLAVRGTGEIWIADIQNCRITNVQDGSVVVVAGNGDCAFGGDGAPAEYATLSNPLAVAVDAANNAYISDRNNCRIRKVTAGVITTVAGTNCDTAVFPPFGEGVPATDGAVVARSMAVTPGGEIYILDDYGCKLRRISGGLITTIAGTGICGNNVSDGLPAAAAQFSGMTGIAVASGGAVYLSEACQIWSVDAGIMHLIAGDGSCTSSGDGGPAVSAELNKPFGLALDNGDLYVAERDGCRIRKITGGVITTVAGHPLATACGFAGDGGSATSGQLNHPTNVAIDGAGVLYIGDMGNCRVRKVQAGVISTAAGNGTCGFGGDGGPATAASLATPIPWVPEVQFLGVAVDAFQNLYIADPGNERVRIVYAADSDGDGDGYTDFLEEQLGKDPAAYCTIMRADVNGSAKVTLGDLILTAQQYNLDIPPATARYNQNGDAKITLADLILMAQVYNQSVGACP